MYFLGLKRAFFRRGKFLANSISMLGWPRLLFETPRRYFPKPFGTLPSSAGARPPFHLPFVRNRVEKRESGTERIFEQRKKKKFLSSNSNRRTNPTIFPFESKNRRFDLLILTKSWFFPSFRRIDDSICNINLWRNFSNRDLNLKKFSLSLVKLFS